MFHRDYRGLKKRITAIRRVQQIPVTSPEEDELVLSPAPLEGPRSSTDTGSIDSIAPAEPAPEGSSRSRKDKTPKTRHITLPPPSGSHAELVSEAEGVDYMADHESASRPSLTVRAASDGAQAHIRRARSGTVTTVLDRVIQRANSTRGSSSHQPRFDMRRSIPLMELLPQLTPLERAFFDKLDMELDKVESFYCDREREMKHRSVLGVTKFYCGC